MSAGVPVAAVPCAGFCLPALSLALGLAFAAPARAQMYHLYLHCQGTVVAGPGAPASEAAGVATRASTPDGQGRARAMGGAAKRSTAHLDLALRDNNMSMLVQRSNVLPAGQRLKYEATQTHYTATFLPQMAGAGFRKWGESWLFGWYPPFQKMTAARFAIDRQSGALEGEVVGPGGQVLGLIDMQCEPKRAEDAPTPRF